VRKQGIKQGTRKQHHRKQSENRRRKLVNSNTGKGRKQEEKTENLGNIIIGKGKETG
jgi:hypothetical protein